MASLLSHSCSVYTEIHVASKNLHFNISAEIDNTIREIRVYAVTVNIKHAKMHLLSNQTNMSNFQPDEIVDRGKNEMNRALGHLCAHIG